jgi:predicted RNA-binding Zn-ribbon protein involved in translation (DUF1610 family)
MHPIFISDSLFSNNSFLVFQCYDCGKWEVKKVEHGQCLGHPKFCEECFEKKWIDIILDRPL